MVRKEIYGKLGQRGTVTEDINAIFEKSIYSLNSKMH